MFLPGVYGALVRRGRVQRLSIPDDFLYIGCEVWIEHWSLSRFHFVGFSQSDALGDSPARRGGRADDGQWFRVAFDDDFRAGLNTFQDGGKFTHRICFADVQRLHIGEDSVSPAARVTGPSGSLARSCIPARP